MPVVAQTSEDGNYVFISIMAPPSSVRHRRRYLPDVWWWVFGDESSESCAPAKWKTLLGAIMHDAQRALRKLFVST